jgi:DNA-binding NtrC family response regulator
MASSVSTLQAHQGERAAETLQTESKKVDASIAPFGSYGTMDVLIVERDSMVAEVFADALADVGISAEITADEDRAIAGCHDSSARVVITGINRRGEDTKGMQFGRAIRARCPALSVVYLAALWPLALNRRALDAKERFLSKPVHVAKLVSTVRELLPA